MHMMARGMGQYLSGDHHPPPLLARQESNSLGNSQTPTEFHYNEHCNAMYGSFIKSYHMYFSQLICQCMSGKVNEKLGSGLV